MLIGSAVAQTKVTKEAWGTLPDGGAVESYTLRSKTLEVRVITFGAHVSSIMAPDRTGTKADVVLGYKDLAGYLADNKTYLGSVVGRYGNRIAKGAFSLDGTAYQLDRNDHGNTLHGGSEGFDRKNWTGKQIPNGVELTLVSKDGDMGFPGTLTAHVRYTLLGSDLHLNYSATADKPTIVNLTNHSYFNLAGTGDILGETLKLNADRYTPVNATLIPTGPLEPVAGTPLDFRTATAIGQRINVENEQLKIAGGYDHNFVLNNGTKPGMKLAAVLTDPGTGRTMTVTTTEPGIQFYSGNFLDGTFHGRADEAYTKYAGLCLETQHYPDSPNEPSYPSTTLKPGQTYHSNTVFAFSAK